MKAKPTRCIDPVMKYCQGCQYGHCIYPEWVETSEVAKERGVNYDKRILLSDRNR